ncbi:MAG TPA: hypothetical protein VI603_01145 [Saprospiraceae bacterium]|nr:hypothetical protein [Saprospiraceae bacterium]
MKHSLIASLIILVSMALWNATYAHCPIPITDSNHFDSGSIPDAESTENSLFRIKLCVNALVVSVCVEFDCDLSWTDIIAPGSGQLFGHSGCVPVGNVTGGDGTSTSFQGSENMILAIENAMKIQKGTLKIFEVIESPTFPGPDGKDYRVVAKPYSVLKGSNGRYLPLEVEAVK